MNICKILFLCITILSCQNSIATCKDTIFSFIETVERLKKSEKRWNSQAIVIIIGEIERPDTIKMHDSSIDLTGYKPDYNDLPCLFVTVKSQLYGRKLDDNVIVFNSKEQWDDKYKPGTQWLFVLIASYSLPFKTEQYLMLEICSESMLLFRNDTIIGNFYPSKTTKLQKPDTLSLTDIKKVINLILEDK